MQLWLPVLRVFLWKRLLKLLDDRKEKIASELKTIEDTQAETSRIKADYETKITEIDKEAAKRIQKATEEAQKAAEGIRKKAEEEAKTEAKVEAALASHETPPEPEEEAK